MMIFVMIFSYDDEYEDEDMDTLYRNYEILSKFYQKYYVDLRILDLTCEPSAFPAPTVKNARILQYKEVGRKIYSSPC